LADIAAAAQRAPQASNAKLEVLLLGRAGDRNNLDGIIVIGS